MKHNYIKLELDLPDNVTDVRIDPGDNACICHIIELSTRNNQTQIKPHIIGGVDVGNDWILYEEDDPQFSFSIDSISNRTLLVELEICYLSKEVLKELTNRAKQQQTTINDKITEIEHMKIEQQILQQEIYNMKNTKIWKLYERYRRLRRR